MKMIRLFSFLLLSFSFFTINAQVNFASDTVYLTNTGINGEYEGSITITSTTADIGDLAWERIERTIEPLVWNTFVYSCDSIFFPFSVAGPITRESGVNNCFLGVNITNLEGGLPRGTNQIRLLVTSSSDPNLSQELAFILNPVPVSTKNLLPTDFLNIAPNPVKDRLQISLPEKPEEEAFLSIFNIQGKLLRREKIGVSHFALSMTELEKGMYILQVEMKGKRAIKKFVKE